MIRPPNQMSAFEFVAIATLRVAQLTRGCTPRVCGDHVTAVLAQREVAEGKVTRIAEPAIVRDPGVGSGTLALGLVHPGAKRVLGDSGGVIG